MKTLQATASKNTEKRYLVRNKALNEIDFYFHSEDKWIEQFPLSSTRNK
jgi:hypothetical protein